MIRTLAGTTLALALGACGTDFTVASTPLAGTVGGQPWTFVAGDTDAFLSEGETDFFASFYAATFTPCGFSSPSGNHLIVAVPKEPGEYDFSLSLNMTFVVGASENLVATEGVVIVDEVTPTLARGGLHGTFDGDNEVDGRFELTVCADTP
jgi:hypothetical protein